MKTRRLGNGQSIVMNAENFTVSWIDLAVVALLGFGLWRGRKRGMSEELLDIIKWAVILVVAGLLYEPSGRLLSELTSVFSLLSCYVTMYIALALLVVLFISMIRKSVGAKLVGSDVFGAAEYYLGMMAGAFRYACIILVGMAFLNARYYSPEELRAGTKYQEDNFGTTFFLTWPDLQQEVFKRSFAGRLTHEYLNVVLIRPTAGEGKSLGGDNAIGRQRERSVHDALDKRK
jgi:uncharacterized membrane protein required for colicin V production